MCSWTVFNFFVFIPGLTDEEVELAIQRSGSTEEVLPLSPVTFPHSPYAAPTPPSEYTESLLMEMIFWCTFIFSVKT